MKADSVRKANGWAPCVEHDNGCRELCRARYGTLAAADRHAQELIDAYRRRPDLVGAIPANRLLER